MNYEIEILTRRINILLFLIIIVICYSIFVDKYIDNKITKLEQKIERIENVEE